MRRRRTVRRRVPSCRCGPSKSQLQSYGSLSSIAKSISQSVGVNEYLYQNYKYIYNPWSGRGIDGQYWLCLRDLELYYKGRFERITGLVNTPLTHLYENVEFIESLYPEARSNSTFPGILNLSSAQKHTVYLRIAVHRYILDLADPANAGVKKLLDQEVACEKAFPGDV